MALRKAFVIALYHHWERAIRASAAGANGNHDKLVKRAQAKGILIDARIGALRDLVNALKHDSDRCGKALLSSWPDIFSPNFQPGTLKTDWYRAVSLKDHHVVEAFEIVSGSGPIVKVV